MREVSPGIFWFYEPVPDWSGMVTNDGETPAGIAKTNSLDSAVRLSSSWRRGVLPFRRALACR